MDTCSHVECSAKEPAGNFSFVLLACNSAPFQFQHGRDLLVGISSEGRSVVCAEKNVERGTLSTGWSGSLEPHTRSSSPLSDFAPPKGVHSSPRPGILCIFCPVGLDTPILGCISDRLLLAASEAICAHRHRQTPCPDKRCLPSWRWTRRLPQARSQTSHKTAAP